MCILITFIIDNKFLNKTVTRSINLKFNLKFNNNNKISLIYGKLICHWFNISNFLINCYIHTSICIKLVSLSLGNEQCRRSWIYK